MNDYTISKLAEDAGVSKHIVRGYELQGLIRPCKSTNCGYRNYDEGALQRLRFVLAGKVTGISLDDLSALCQVMDNNDLVASEQFLIDIESALEQKK